MANSCTFVIQATVYFDLHTRQSCLLSSEQQRTWFLLDVPLVASQNGNADGKYITYILIYLLVICIAH